MNRRQDPTTTHLPFTRVRPGWRAVEATPGRSDPRASKQPPSRIPAPTRGYRISEGDASLCYIPDQELALGLPLSARERHPLPGFDLAYGASLLIHDCQYTDDEYPNHIGLGHSRLGDVLAYAQLTEAQRLLLFHHDPLHDDEQLDRLYAEALARCAAAGGSPQEVLMAAELQELELDPAGDRVSAIANAHRP